MTTFFQRIASFLMTIYMMICSLLGIPTKPNSNTIDINNFDLVWSDEFNGNSVDETKWSGHYVYGSNTTVRNGGYWNKELASVGDGCLTITSEYLENGVNPGDPAGIYSYGMDTRKSFNGTYGYYEVRCILPKGRKLWSSFWIYGETVPDIADEGVNGAEIDIFESPYFGDTINNYVSSNIHCDGYGDNHKSLGAKKFKVQGDPYSEFNTYGLEWNESGYIFYINGVKTFSTDWGGVCTVPEFMVLSVEVGGSNGNPDINSLDGIDSSKFIVDYVRAYKYK